VIERKRSEGEKERDRVELEEGDLTQAPRERERSHAAMRRRVVGMPAHAVLVERDDKERWGFES
jgi:hypothetical protein